MYMSFKQELLSLINDFGELTYKIITTPRGQLSIKGLYYPKATYYGTIRRLSADGLVKKTKKANIVSVSLTPKGKALLKQPIVKKHRSDGLSTIVIFDVPEKQRKARQALRKYLLRSGYISLQESVMISPFIAGGELKELIRELKLEPSVSVILGKIDHYFR